MDGDDDDEQYLEEFEKIQKNAKNNKAGASDDDEYENDDQFEESPRPKISSQGALSGPRDNEDGDQKDGEGLPDDEEDIDEDEVIDVAERIFVQIANAIVDQKRRSIREVFQDNLFEAEIDGQIIELLSPMGLLEGIKALGINDLSEKEIAYLLRVLTKPELDSAIVMPEFL